MYFTKLKFAKKRWFRKNIGTRLLWDAWKWALHLRIIHAHNWSKFSCHTGKNTFFAAVSDNVSFCHSWEYSHWDQSDCGSPISLKSLSSDPWKYISNFHFISVKFVIQSHQDLNYSIDTGAHVFHRRPAFWTLQDDYIFCWTVAHITITKLFPASKSSSGFCFELYPVPW